MFLSDRGEKQKSKGSMIITAEIGSNHLGRYNLAIKHIEEAARSGATAVKFQLFRAETYYGDPQRQKKVKPHEIPLEWISALKDSARRCGMQFGVSVFAPDLVEPIRGFVDFVKIASLDIGYLDLIQAASKLDIPMIISTGAASLEEIHKALSVMTHDRLTLLHCVCAYPVPFKMANLRTISTLQRSFSIPIGYSDHTRGYEAAMLATVLGCSLIEKHFRLPFEEVRRSPDFPHSAAPGEFSVMVEMIRETELALGVGQKDGPLPIEQDLVWAKRSNDKPLR